MNANQSSEINSILEQIAAITSMDRGKLAEVYRTRPAPHGEGTIRLGPYYKLQTWEGGRNVTRHVPVAEAPSLKENLANHRRFVELTTRLENLIIAQTRALREAPESHDPGADAKKNSTKRRKPNGASKRRPSSPGPGQA